MRTLELNQMENVEGGKMDMGCAFALIGTAAAFAGLFVATGGAGAVIAAISWSVAPAGAALSCLDY